MTTRQFAHQHNHSAYSYVSNKPAVPWPLSLFWFRLGKVLTIVGHDEP